MKKIPLTQGQFSLVDDIWYDFLMQWKWYAKWDPFTRSYRAVRNDKELGTILMHRVVMNTPKNMQCDHIDHDTLNNQSSNLRNVTLNQNMMNKKKYKKNSSGYKGVSWSTQRNMWHVQIQKNGVKFHCFHEDVLEAAKIYDEKAKELFGEFAYLNFPK